MRKIILIFCTLLICVGCTSNKESDNKSFAIFGYDGVSEAGIYHLVTNDLGSFVYFYDKESDKDVPLCAKANCDHKNKQCNAYLLASYHSMELVMAPVYYGDTLYYVYEDHDTAKNVLCISDETGDKRKEIKELPEGIISSSMLYQNKLYMSFNEFEYDEDGNIKGMSEVYHNYVYDLKDGRMDILDVDKNTSLSFFGSYKGNIYLSMVKRNEKGAYQKSFGILKADSKKPEMYIKEAPADNLFLYEQNVYYLRDNEVIEMNVETKKERIMKHVDIKDGYIISASNDNEGMMIFDIGENKKFKKNKYLDLATNEFIESKFPIVHKLDTSYIVVDKGNYHLLKK